MSTPPTVPAAAPEEREPRAGTLQTLVDLVPEGWTLVRYQGRPYGLTRTTRAGGKSVSVLAQELGGSDLVSANIYRTTGGDLLRACEMPQQKVLDFMRGWRPQDKGPETDPARGTTYRAIADRLAPPTTGGDHDGSPAHRGPQRPRATGPRLR